VLPYAALVDLLPLPCNLADLLLAFRQVCLLLAFLEDLQVCLLECLLLDSEEDLRLASLLRECLLECLHLDFEVVVLRPLVLVVLRLLALAVLHLEHSLLLVEGSSEEYKGVRETCQSRGVRETCQSHYLIV